MGIFDKKLLLPNHLLWTVTKEGKYNIYVGPMMLDISEDETLLAPNKSNHEELMSVETLQEAIQKFVTIKTGEYAVIHNPAKGSSGINPNSSFTKSGKNSMSELDHGEKKSIISGNFPLWPGQWIEKRPIHKISADEFLMVEIIDRDVDKTAPYYPLLVQCSEIKNAVLDDSVKSEDGELDVEPQ